jgi:hypothetical protein
MRSGLVVVAAYGLVGLAGAGGAFSGVSGTSGSQQTQGVVSFSVGTGPPHPMRDEAGKRKTGSDPRRGSRFCAEGSQTWEG